MFERVVKELYEVAELMDVMMMNDDDSHDWGPRGRPGYQGQYIEAELITGPKLGLTKGLDFSGAITGVYFVYRQQGGVLYKAESWPGAGVGPDLGMSSIRRLANQHYQLIHQCRHKHTSRQNALI